MDLYLTINQCINQILRLLIQSLTKILFRSCKGQKVGNYESPDQNFPAGLLLVGGSLFVYFFPQGFTVYLQDLGGPGFISIYTPEYILYIFSLNLGK